MAENLLILLGKWIGEDSKVYLFLESLILNNSTAINLTITFIALALISYLIYQLLWWKYLSYKVRGERPPYSTYIENEWYKIVGQIFLWIWIIWIFLIDWTTILLLDKIVSWSSYDWENYSWLAFLFWYKTESTIYQYYNMWRYLLLITITLFTIYNFMMYRSVWKRVSHSWEEKEYYPYFKNWLITLILIIILLFSTIIDATINKISEIITWETIHESIWDNNKL